MQGGVDHDGLTLLKLHLHLYRERGVYRCKGVWTGAELVFHWDNNNRFKPVHVGVIWAG